MEKIIDGVKYKVSPLPLRMALHNAMLSQRLNMKPETIKEADDVGEVIQTLTERIVNSAVTPTPKPEHLTELYDAICEETKRLGDQQEKFRYPEHGIPTPGRVTRASSASKTIKHTST